MFKATLETQNGSVIKMGTYATLKTVAAVVKCLDNEWERGPQFGNYASPVLQNWEGSNVVATDEYFRGVRWLLVGEIWERI